MDSAYCFRLFRDHAALQAVQEELAADRRKSLVMAVDDDCVYHRDALETFSITASYCLERHSVLGCGNAAKSGLA